MGATTGVTWLCACVRYWLYLGTSELVLVLQCLHWYLLKDCQSRSLKNISQFVHTLSVLSTQDKNSKNRECNSRQYWLYLGTSELVRVLQCLHWYLLKDCQSKSLKNISQFVHTLSVLSTQDKNSKNRECNSRQPVTEKNLFSFGF